MGTVDLTAQFGNWLEMDLQGVAVQEGSQYQVLLGCDVLLGRQGVLAPAVIDMAGELRWRFLK